ncbi:cellulase family glycosylhydrolase [Anaeromyxobacter paludicola]|uniref:mannan endo-1,4-beta-mannosidase n=1 Tax=Anaeromyxobacter paludicola TaxID=2918171 RepID=A0ABM7X918_9BACT|nr:cellulase family glycosylhydrolase [Anaeromyxobacter paludicola]BDG08356.1 hypothetical protein AMPC_14690 [Anaeromyxobacter paludicola]
MNRRLELRVPAPPGLDAGAVQVEVTEPGGRTYALPAFQAGGELLARVRPRAAGPHRYRLVAAPPGGPPRALAEGTFDVAGGGAPGPVGRSPADPHALARADGRDFVPLGENRFNVYDPSWQGGASAASYVAAMAAHGMNTLRVFVFTGCPRAPPRDPQPGCLEPALGSFDEAAARDYDRIFEAAEASGVQVILSVFAVGFTPGDAWKGWEDNPYSAARGGPAATPRDFFDDPRARALAARRLRYVAARWGYSTSLLAVDLLNEPEWDGAIPEDAWIPWAHAMGETWRRLDPYGHLVTAGPVGLHWNVQRDERAWWADPVDDVVQWHRYGKDVYEVHALERALCDTVEDTRRYERPVLVGEFAYGGEPKPAYDHTHVGIWSAVFCGAGVLAHSAPPFNEDSDEPMTPERGRHFRALADFLAALGERAPLLPAAAEAEAPPGLRAHAVARGARRALWLLAPAKGYGEPVRGARVRLPLPEGRWRVRWVDDLTGAELGREEVRAAGGPALLRPPPFRRHAAAVLERDPL